MGMHQIPNKVDFYITNVCNLTCDRCNRFNNFDFKGWQRWSDYDETYTQWSKLVELCAITIMGGEPFLNPSLGDWVENLNKLFGIEVQVLTNGTRFKHAKDLYSKFLYRSAKTQAMNHIGVSLHNVNDWPVMQQDIRNFLVHPIQEYKKGDPENLWNSDWHFVDKNGVKINVYRVDEFGPSAVVPVGNNSYRLHNSDPVQAHDACAFAQFKSYHFIKGKLYKCGPVALMPEFEKQFDLDISEEDRGLLNNYQALTMENFDTFHKEFFEHLDRPIPQCKFCPSTWEVKKIYPLRKGL
jgi:organic radical activating enzyme